MHVFIDTSTLAACKFRLGGPLLRTILEYAREGVIALHTTEVTLREIHDVALRKLNELGGKLAEGRGYFNLEPHLDAKVMEIAADCESQAAALVAEFRSRCRWVHGGAGVDCDELITRYLQRRPPFSRQKPDEFKDALAALCLRRWAENNGHTIFVVSEDVDWKSLCDDFACFAKISLGELVARIEGEREGLLEKFSLEAIERALIMSDFEQEVGAWMQGRSWRVVDWADFLCEEASVFGVWFAVERMSVLRIAEISAEINFAASAWVAWGWSDVVLDSFEYEVELRGTAVVVLAPDGRLHDIRVEWVDVCD